MPWIETLKDRKLADPQPYQFPHLAIDLNSPVCNTDVAFGSQPWGAARQFWTSPRRYERPSDTGQTSGSRKTPRAKLLGHNEEDMSYTQQITQCHLEIMQFKCPPQRKAAWRLARSLHLSIHRHNVIQPVHSYRSSRGWQFEKEQLCDDQEPPL